MPKEFLQKYLAKIFGRTITPIFSPIIIGLLTHDGELLKSTNTIN